MTQPPPFRAFSKDDAIHAAARALASTGWTIGPDSVTDLGGADRRNLILRALATGPDGTRSVIIKASRAANYVADAADAYDRSGLVKEWAARSLLARRTGDTGELLAADLQAGVLIFAEHGTAPPALVGPLLHGTAEEAEQALAAYARALARLHRRTADCVAEHTAIIHAALPNAALPGLGTKWRGIVPPGLTRLLGDALPSDELDEMERRLRAPGPWLALVHHDPCPDNIVFTAADDARLIDFEFTSPGHALLDTIYWRMGFPTCWCAGRVPEHVADRLDAVYRDATSAFADAAAWRREQAVIAMLRLFAGLEWLLEDALAADHDWGTATNRSRILHYLRTATRLSKAAGVLPDTTAIAVGWLARLRTAWPGVEALPLYPAFR